MWFLVAVVAAIALRRDWSGRACCPRPGHPTSSWLVPWWLLAVGVTVAETLPVQLHIGRHGWSASLIEIPLVIGLTMSSSRNVVIGQVVGCVIARGMINRQADPEAGVQRCRCAPSNRARRWSCSTSSPRATRRPSPGYGSPPTPRYSPREPSAPSGWPRSCESHRERSPPTSLANFAARRGDRSRRRDRAWPSKRDHGPGRRGRHRSAGAHRRRCWSSATEPTADSEPATPAWTCSTASPTPSRPTPTTTSVIDDLLEATRQVLDAEIAELVVVDDAGRTDRRLTGGNLPRHRQTYEPLRPPGRPSRHPPTGLLASRATMTARSAAWLRRRGLDRRHGRPSPPRRSDHRHVGGGQPGGRRRHLRRRQPPTLRDPGQPRHHLAARTPS